MITPTNRTLLESPMVTNAVVQTIKDAEVDARSLSEFIYKPADAMVSRRLAPSIRPLNYYLQFFDGAVSRATADAKEIGRQLISAQQQALGTVSYIESTIRGAIDTTVIENSPVSDALVSVDGALSQRTINKGLESIADLSTIKNPKDGLRVYVKSYHAGLGIGGGNFTYDSTKANVNDGGNVINGWIRDVSDGYYNVQNFGAIGDGDHSSYKDHDAFKAISDLIVKTGAGKYCIDIPTPKSCYVVGKQVKTGRGSYGVDSQTPIDISFSEMTDVSIVVRSCDAKIQLRNGLRYGVFDRETNEKVITTLPFHPGLSNYNAIIDSIYVTSLGHMFNFYNISDLYITGKLELDGNRHNQIIGGKYGDNGHQLSASGIHYVNVKRHYIENVYTHNHCWDGIYVAGYNTQTDPDAYDPDLWGVLRNIRSQHNGRQGMSLCGGQNIDIYSSIFSHIGLTEHEVVSGPSAGVDVEAERSPIRRVSFYNCEFSNVGSEAFVAASGDIKDVTLTNCLLSNHSTLWTEKPNFKLYNCHINGVIKKLFGTLNDSERTLFRDCLFETNNKYVDEEFSHSDFIVSAGNANPKFYNCNFILNKTGFIYGDSLLSESKKGCEIIGGTCKFQDGARNIIFYDNSSLTDFTFIDNRINPTGDKVFHYGGVEFNNTKVVATYDGMPKISGWGYDFVDNKLSKNTIYLRQSANAPSTFENKALTGVYTNNNTNTVQFSYSATLVPLLSNRVGDRIYCTDPTKNIDYWICTTAGNETTSQWKAIQANEVPQT